MARCVASLIAFAVPWMSFWVLVILIAAKIVAGPVGWIALALALSVSLALLVWAIRTCSGR